MAAKRQYGGIQPQTVWIDERRDGGQFCQQKESADLDVMQHGHRIAAATNNIDGATQRKAAKESQPHNE